MSYSTPKLKPVKGGNRFCGPAAISTITGISTDDASRIIRHITGRRQVTWTSTHEVHQAMQWRGYRIVEKRMDGDNPTLARWLRERQNRRATYLINVTNHWVVVRGNKFVDSKHRDPVNTRQAKGRRARVKRVYTVFRDKLLETRPIPPKPSRA